MRRQLRGGKTDAERAAARRADQEELRAEWKRSGVRPSEPSGDVYVSESPTVEWTPLFSALRRLADAAADRDHHRAYVAARDVAELLEEGEPTGQAESSDEKAEVERTLDVYRRVHGL
jgi:hypothetical protein